MILKEMPTDERPREKALKYGVKALCNRELLAIIIRNGIKSYSALDIADDILKKAKGVKGLKRLNINELNKIKGIKNVKAIELMVVFELVNRMLYEEILDVNIITSPKKLIDWLKLEFGHLQQELFIVIFLNTKNHIIDYSIIFKGTLNASIVHPREIFKDAIVKSSSSIIAVHNHPSGDPTPSKSDIIVTKKISDVGKIMDIKVVDHIIVGFNNYYSFSENNLL